MLHPISFATMRRQFLAGGTGIRRFTNPHSTPFSQIPARPRRHPLSTWEHAQNVWQSRGGQRRPTPEEVARAERRRELRKQQQRLEMAVRGAVRRHLAATFENEFALRSSSELVLPSPLPAVTSSLTFGSGRQPPQLSASGRILLALNGFEGLELPQSTDRLKLAEGVVATPRWKELAPFLIFAQPAVQDDYSVNKQKILPPIVQQGLTLYRVMEDQAASFLDARYNAMVGFVHRRIRMPLESTADKLTGGGRPRLSSREAIHEIQQTRPEGGGDDNRTANSPHKDVTTMAFQSALNTQPAVPQKANGDSDDERLETLLVVSRDEILLYQHMTPSLRIVALPHILRHSSASTLVSVSLVVFGALPLAYRSYNFASSYPGLSQTIAASVVATISYGIWSHRVTARTSQSQVVTHALAHRLYARDDACVLVLQEGAIHHVSQAVLAAYYRHCRLQDRAGSRKGDDKGNHKGINELDPEPPRTSAPSNNLESVNATDLAIQFGLLKVKKNDQLDDIEHNGYQAIALKEAILLMSST